jgi:sulfotransferase family protein
MQAVKKEEFKMPLKVIGAGIGRTGTYSLKLALNELGLGPCHHMEEVLINAPTQIPLWVAATQGNPDWNAIFDEYASTVDWPTARFYRELHKAYPQARFILTDRNPETWAQSFGETIYKLLAGADQAPAEMKPWLDMAQEIINQTGFPPGLDEAGLSAAFTAHCEAVKAAIPASQLLVYQVRQGWEPLCAFLDLPVPDVEFPRTNNRSEFWDLVAKNT